jgi:mannose-6-phosphate isomerase-like protein (cupin superfamily)
MEAFDIARTFVHLGRGASATPIPDFEWSPEFLAAYSDRFRSDDNEGRLVCLVPQPETWDSWERHPAGEEVVILISGRIDLVQDLPGGEHVIELHPGQAAINPTNVWHTARVHEPGDTLFITPGEGTEHRPLH